MMEWDQIKADGPLMGVGDQAKEEREKAKAEKMREEQKPASPGAHRVRGKEEQVEYKQQGKNNRRLFGANPQDQAEEAPCVGKPTP